MCPVENIEYVGQCHVSTCPAFDKKAETGCLYQEIKNISQFSIGKRWKLTNAKIKKKYKHGLKILTESAKFYHLAQQHYIAPINTCKNCGIEGKDCLNTLRCTRRAKFAQKQIKKLPMRVLNITTLPAFWVIISTPNLQPFFKPKTVAKAEKLLSRRKTNATT